MLNKERSVKRLDLVAWRSSSNLNTLKFVALKITADRRVKPSYIPRLSKNSLKAGKEPGLDSSRSRASGSAELVGETRNQDELAI